jgi:hypothetical protein
MSNDIGSGQPTTQAKKTKQLTFERTLFLDIWREPRTRPLFVYAVFITTVGAA